MTVRLALIAVACLGASCRSERPSPRNTASERAAVPRVSPSDARRATCSLPRLPSRYPAPARVVAIGDLHGDLEATRAALRLAGAIDEADQWVGGDLAVVQTGDILDRGDGEQAILDLFESLAAQASASGGAVHVLNGNHELMNAVADFRYVTRGGFEDFADVDGLDLAAAGLERLPAHVRPRAAAFAPGGPYALLLARHNAVVVVGDTAFVHGGVTAEYADYGIERLNREIRCWLADAGPKPRAIGDPDGPLWSRRFSVAEADCAELTRALEALRAARMVMGHEPQPGGISSACDGKAWRIDAGLAALYGGPLEVLEISAQRIRVLRGM